MGTTVENRWHFGVPIMDATIDGFTARQPRIAAHLLALRDADKGLVRSNQGGWHSGNDLFRTQDPDLRWLLEQVYAIAAPCIRQVEGERFQGEVPMSECWANINDGGSWNAPHVHLPNEWSGCVYVSVEEALRQRAPGNMDGDILFINPMPAGPEYNRPPFTNYTPKDGQMFIFPGYMLHMVAPHRASVPRISIAFNFKLVSKR